MKEKRWVFLSLPNLLEDGGTLLVDSFLLLCLRHSDLHSHLLLLPIIHIKELSDCLLRHKVKMRHIQDKKIPLSS